MATLLLNSRRIARMASYTPVRLTTAPSDGGDLVSTAGLIRGLELLPEELDALVRHAATEESRAAATAISTLARAGSADQIQEATVNLGRFTRQAIVQAITDIRTARLKTLVEAAATLTPRTEAGTDVVSPAAVAASRWRSALPGDIAADVGVTQGLVAWHPQSVKLASASPAPAPAPPRLLVNKSIFFGPGGASLVAEFIRAIEPYVPPGTDVAALDPLDTLEELDRKGAACTFVIDALSRREVQPLGLLHLEALSMTPDDVQRGELVFSLPLAPKEKVTLSHKEWSVRESEFSEFVQDSIEHYSERGVAEADEIAISSQHESRKTERTGVGSSGGVTMTGPADAGSTVVTNASSQQESRRHAQTITSQASSRSVRDHKVSFTVATVSGTEDFTSRLLENPASDKTMRVDYFRRMKRWKVELFRTGVRLAYDIVIPDPGRRLRLRQELIRKYDRALTAAFDPGLRPGDVTRLTWPDYASAYGVALAAPPADPDASPAFAQWQVKAFSSLRDAAYAKFSEVQETIRQRRADAARQIEAAADPQELRRMEREEIQRLTLAWLVPGFPGSSAIPSGPTEPQGLSDASWQQALEFGEYIKFVHSAIDWARLSYFLYPYFWSDRQIDRLYLRHPDADHRDFLRAGAARVVVPIVPGSEEALTTFIDGGRVGRLPNGHRFGPLVAAVKQAHELFGADGNGTWHGDDDEDDSGRGKVRIASWTEFTPTGALDIEVATRAVEDD